jgi:alpha-mannosidase
MALPLPWTPADGSAAYGIPFGLLERASYIPQPGRHGCANGDWPVLGLVAVRDPVDDTWVAVLERGNPAARVVKNVLRIGLMRSPSHATLGSMIEGACDKGRHRFDFALISGRGKARELQLMERARAFNTTPVAVSLPENAGGDWPSHHALLSLAATPAPVASCLKRSDNGNELVLRAFDPYGQGADLALNGPLSGQVRRLNMTEEPVPDHKQHLHPFGIATLEIGKGEGVKSDLSNKLTEEMKT